MLSANSALLAKLLGVRLALRSSRWRSTSIVSDCEEERRRLVLLLVSHPSPVAPSQLRPKGQQRLRPQGLRSRARARVGGESFSSAAAGKPVRLRTFPKPNLALCALYLRNIISSLCFRSFRRRHSRRSARHDERRPFVNLLLVSVSSDSCLVPSSNERSR